MAEDQNPLNEKLRSLVPIGDLPAQHQNEVVKQAEILNVKKGKHVFEQGDRDGFSFYVLEGELELSSDGQLVKSVAGGTDAAKTALSQLQPRQMTARAKTAVKVARFDRGLLDRLLTLEDTSGSGEMGVAEIDTEEDVDWMTVMLQSELFARIPPANIQGVFARMEALSVAAGDVVVEQGTPGDYYFIIQKGRCAITRRSGADAKPIQLAELSEGDSFGEEALVSDAKRNASVTMLTDGELMRLTKKDFVDLIKKPALSAVKYEEAEGLVAGGAVWLDVRFPDERQEISIDGSLNMPLNVLRVKADTLDAEKSYVVFCDSGSRSSAGAFLLTQKGFDACYLAGGLNSTPLAQAARVQESPPAEPERPTAKPGPAPAPKAPAEAAAPGTAPAKAAPAMAAPAKAPPANVAPAKAPDAASGPAAATRGATSEVVDADVKASALRAELDKAKLELEKALRAKNEAEAAQRTAEKVGEEKVKLAAEKLKQESTSTSAALKEARESAVAASEAKQAAQAEAARQAREKEEIAALQAQAERAKAEAARELEAALEAKVAAEEARQAAEQTAATRLEEERAKMEAEANRASQALDEAKRLKAEVEAAKLAADEEAEKKRRVHEETIERVKQEAEQRLVVGEAKLEAEYAKQAEQLTDMQSEREKLANALAAERDRMAAESAAAKKRLEEARELAKKVEAERRAMERDAKKLTTAHERAEAKLKEQVTAKIRSERQKLEADFARNAELLAQAEQAKAAAEAARKAAGEEAERIMAEQQAEFEKVKAEAEAKLRAEREALEAEAKSIEARVSEAAQAREEAIARQSAKKADSDDARKAAADAAPEREDELRAALAAAEARLTEADSALAEAEVSHQEAVAEQGAIDAELDRSQSEQEQIRRQIEEEAAAWIQEQDAQDAARASTVDSEAEEEHRQRIKEKADEARRKEGDVVVDMLDEIAAQLDSGDG